MRRRSGPVGSGDSQITDSHRDAGALLLDKALPAKAGLHMSYMYDAG
ncbi:hypothetical protein [Nonomuraea lactucae]|nr:hypothetical protein [Nonomuraea lactucae]